MKKELKLEQIKVVSFVTKTNGAGTVVGGIASPTDYMLVEGPYGYDWVNYCEPSRVHLCPMTEDLQCLRESMHP